VRWDSLTAAPAPYVPAVTHELDTQNFESYEDGEGEGTPSPAGRGRWARADPHFIGYTYKAWEAVSPPPRARPKPCNALLQLCCIGTLKPLSVA
jgi:serine/threonine kinase 38